MKPKKRLLIDGDEFLYRESFGHETEINWFDGFHTLHSDAEEVWSSIHNQILTLIDEHEPDETIFALSSNTNFRKELYPDYKKNREGKRKPLCFKTVRDQFLNQSDSIYRVVSIDGLEADDVIGIMATKSGVDPVIISRDKDLKQIEDESFFWLQILTGDSVDNYPGCPGIGPKTAQKIIEANESNNLWSYVVKAYEKAGLTEEDALVQARLARILQHEDFDFKKMEPILWEPNK